MSFSLTTEQIRTRRKTVTRRVGWTFLKSGDLLQPVVSSQGLRKGEHVEKIGGPIRVLHVTREPLRVMKTRYDALETLREGFPLLTVDEFIAMFCATHRIPTNDGSIAIGGGRSRSRPCEPGDEVTRIRFEYVEC